MTRLLASRIALETESSSPLPVLKQRKQLLNQNDNSQHHPKRILQLSTSDTFDGGSDSYSMIFFIFMIIVFIVLVGCLIKKNRDRYRRLPPREVLLEQRRRQRALIRRQRLRQMGIDPDSIAVNVRNDGASGTRSNNRLSLTTEQLESRRKLLLRTFEMDQVQTVSSWKLFAAWASVLQLSIVAECHCLRIGAISRETLSYAALLI